MELSERGAAEPLISRKPANRFWLVTGVVALVALGLVVAVISMGLEIKDLKLHTAPPSAPSSPSPTAAPSSAPTALAPAPRNVILMISDGFGPASETMARSFLQQLNNLAYNATLPLDRMLVGTSRTRAWETLVTDSSAGATAFACGTKSLNAYVGLDWQGRRCETLLEAAKKLGMKTGLVATSRITHATPASFSAHVTNRDDEATIAEQQVGESPPLVDLLLGGGLCNFVSNSTPSSCRKDGVDLIARAQGRGYHVVYDKDNLDAANSLPLLGLFSGSHMAFEIDRMNAVAGSPEAAQPPLSSMARKALQLLSAAAQHDATGFFLMLEGSKIDLAGHNHDPAAHLREILRYQDTVALVQEFALAHPNTAVVSVADHETGGLTLAVQLTEAYPDYKWNPMVLEAAVSSTEVVWKKITAWNMSSSPPPTPQQLRDFILTATQTGLGINLTSMEVDHLVTAVAEHGKGLLILSKALSDRAELGWTTEGHTGVDVNLYAFPEHNPVAQELAGNHENTDIGFTLARYLKLQWPIYYDKLNKPHALPEPSKSHTKSHSTRRRR